MSKWRKERERNTLLFLHDEFDDVFNNVHSFELQQVLGYLLPVILLGFLGGLQLKIFLDELFIILEEAFKSIMVPKYRINGVKYLKEGHIVGLPDTHLIKFLPS